MAGHMAGHSLNDGKISMILRASADIGVTAAPVGLGDAAGLVGAVRTGPPWFSGDQLVRVTRPYRVCSGLHRMLPLPRRVGYFR